MTTGVPELRHFLEKTTSIPVDYQRFRLLDNTIFLDSTAPAIVLSIDRWRLLPCQGNHLVYVECPDLEGQVAVDTRGMHGSILVAGIVYPPGAGMVDPQFQVVNISGILPVYKMNNTGVAGFLDADGYIVMQMVFEADNVRSSDFVTDDVKQKLVESGVALSP